MEDNMKYKQIEPIEELRSKDLAKTLIQHIQNTNKRIENLVSGLVETATPESLRYIQGITNTFNLGAKQNHVEVSTRKEFAASQHENLQLNQKIKTLEAENHRLKEKVHQTRHSAELESSQKMEGMLEKELLDTKRLLSEQHVQNEAHQMELKDLKTSMTTMQAVRDQKTKLQLQVEQGKKQIQEITIRQDEAQHRIKELKIAIAKYQNLEEANGEIYSF